MVRIEKIAYQRIVNGSTRNSALGSPKKWFGTNPFLHLRLNHYNFLNKNFFGRILAPFVNWFTQVQMRFHLDIFAQQGLTPEDRLLHLDKTLRRGILFEHIARETLHPYHWVLKSRRRQRWAKIDFALPGFFVPDYIKNEAASHTYIQYLRLNQEWADHLHNNYFSDITPTARRSHIPKANPFEFIQNYGVIRHDGWDKLFMNEKNDVWYTQKETQIVRDSKRFPFNLTTDEGKKQFEEYITDFNQKVPGAFAPPGQKFDFKTYYAELGV